MQKRKSKIIGIKFFHSSIQTRILVILAFNSTGVIISCNKPVIGWLRKISVYVIMEVVEIKKIINLDILRPHQMQAIYFNGKITF